MKPYYEHAGITIYHGDCREVLQRLPVAFCRGCKEPLADESILAIHLAAKHDIGPYCDLLLTDPPYRHAHMDGGGFASARKFYAEGALEGPNDFRLEDYWAVLEPFSPMMIAFCSRDLIGSYCDAAERSRRKFDLHVWHKTNAIPFTANTWKSDLEYIALIWELKPGWIQLAQHMHSKAWISPINQDDSHPAAKPVDLLSKYVSVLDPRMVCDPFMGSGTTLEAAKKQGKSAIGIEIEEKYCEIAAKRLSQEVFDFSSP